MKFSPHPQEKGREEDLPPAPSPYHGEGQSGGSAISNAGDEASSPFDAMAEGYDTGFTHTQIGALMRRAVWNRLDARFFPGDRVLELNCGTGEDACYLGSRGMSVLATDVSEAMVTVARAKLEQAGLQETVAVQRLALEQIGDLQIAGRDVPFDGALSNFGGLNCVSDWRKVAIGLAGCLRPGAVALLCVMGPLCPWEWGWYLAHGKPGKAFRRLKREGTAWRGLTIRYPSLRTLCRAFAPEFRLLRASAVGLFVPPSYVEAWAARHPRLLTRLNAWERRVEAWPFAPALADHYLLELERQ